MQTLADLYIAVSKLLLICYPSRRVTRFAVTVGKLTIFFLLAVVSATCSSGPEFSVKDKREVQGARSIAAFNVNNSRGTVPLSQNFPVSKNYSRWVDINLVSNSQLNDVEVSDKIYNAYKVAKGDTKVCVIPVEIPAGQSYVYDLEWTEILREGVIEEGATGGGRQLGTYQILIDMSCQVVGQFAMGSTQQSPVASITPPVAVTPRGYPAQNVDVNTLTAPTASVTPPLLVNLTPDSTGRIQVAYPREMRVDDSAVVVLEVLIDPQLAALGIDPKFETGIVTIETTSPRIERAKVADRVRLYPIMSAELVAPDFGVSQSAFNSIRPITVTTPAIWTWNITAKRSGVHDVTVNLYGEVTSVDAKNYILAKSSTWQIFVQEKDLFLVLREFLGQNWIAILSASGPIGLIIALLTLFISRSSDKHHAKKRR